MPNIGDFSKPDNVDIVEKLSLFQVKYNEWLENQ